jgi:hypothetical protein
VPLQVPAVTDGLLPMLIQRALDAPPGGSTAVAASKAAAALVNKLPSEGLVQSAVALAVESPQCSTPLAAPEGRLPEAQRACTCITWLTKAVAMRGGPKPVLDSLLGLLIGVTLGMGDGPGAGGLIGLSDERLAVAMEAAEGFGVIMGDQQPGVSHPVLASRPGATRMTPLWRQRLYHLSFRRLKEGVQLRGEDATGKAPALLAVCNLIAGVPRSVIEPEVEAIVLVVIQVRVMGPEAGSGGASAVPAFESVILQAIIHSRGG